MALFDSLINEVAQKFGLGGKAAPLVSGLLSMMTSDTTGGLNGFLDKFRQGGIGDMVTSWVGSGENKSISENQVQSALGFDSISNLAKKVGIATPLAASALSFIIPKAINLLTPNGSIPTGIPASVSSFMSAWGDKTEAVSSTAKHAYSSASHAASQGRSGLSKIWPILAVALLAVVGYKFCTRSHTPAEVTDSAAVIQTGTASANPSLSLVNENGKITYSGVVANEEAKAQIEDQLKTSFGADKIEEDTARGGIKVDPTVKSIEWLPKLSGVLSSFTLPGATLSIDGDQFKVGGNIASNKLNDMVNKMKTVLGTGFAVSLLNLDVGAIKQKVGALVGASTGGAPEDVIKALNTHAIYFNSGSANLSSENKMALKAIAAGMKSLPSSVQIQVSGNADNSGNQAQNDRLALARANAARDYLIRSGVNSQQLTAKGYSDLNPVADNGTTEGRHQNRRLNFSLAK